MDSRKRIVFSLYRAKMRIANAYGYQYGKWESKYICNYSKLNESYLRRMHEKNILGKYIGNNTRFQYKRKRDKMENTTIYDYAFECMKKINQLDHYFQFDLWALDHDDEYDQDSIMFLPGK
tara:strand:+ start:1166 stop:1528 length:363 start_codon:yes stop_codon:yes gene_type:complete